MAAALATIYLVWGSTYLAIRVTDRTMPPLLMSSVRFLIAGAALYAFASRSRPRPTLRQWGAAAIVGAALLLVGNGGVAWAETRLGSGLAALMVATRLAVSVVALPVAAGTVNVPAGIVGKVGSADTSTAAATNTDAADNTTR